VEHAAEIRLTKEYYAETYDQNVRYCHRWRKLEILVGVLLLVGGVALRVAVPSLRVISIFAAASGIYAFAKPILLRPWWLRQRLNSPASGGVVRLSAEEEGLRIEGPHSKGIVEWGGFARSQETPKGLFLWPEQGVVLYLPRAAVGGDLIGYVREKVG